MPVAIGTIAVGELALIMGPVALLAVAAFAMEPLGPVVVALLTTILTAVGPGILATLRIESPGLRLLAACLLGLPVEPDVVAGIVTEIIAAIE